MSSVQQTSFDRVQLLKEILVDWATGRGTSEMEGQYKDLRAELLKSSFAAQAPSFVRTCRSLPEFWGYIQPKFSTYKERREHLREQFEPVLFALEFGHQLTNPPSGARFFPAGSDHDAFREIRSVIKTSSHEIVVVDPYVDETLWPLLENLTAGVTIRILTQTMKGDFKVEGTKFSKQHGFTLQIRASNAFHDRFLIIDGKRVWHLGSSIKDAGAKAFLMSEISTQSVADLTRRAIDNEWNTTQKVL